MKSFKNLQEEELVEESWDKKKIAIAIFLIVLLVAIGIKSSVLSIDFSKIKGANTQRQYAGRENQSDKALFSLPSKDELKINFQQKVESIKDQVTNLNVNDIASSSPQIQKIINDIKVLEKLPSHQAKQVCENICKSL